MTYDRAVALDIRILETDADILAAFPLMSALRDRIKQLKSRDLGLAGSRR